MDSGKFRVILEPSAEKQLVRLDSKIQLRIRVALRLLAQNPTPPNSRKLIGRAGYRVRVGDYRILYDFDGSDLLVLIFQIAHRSRAYK